jgi:hypothetical protein
MIQKPEDRPFCEATHGKPCEQALRLFGAGV